MYREIKNTYKILNGKPEVNILLGRSRYMCKDNIWLDFKEIHFSNVDWIQNLLSSRLISKKPKD
jgi:hypothetical protein